MLVIRLTITSYYFHYTYSVEQYRWDLRGKKFLQSNNDKKEKDTAQVIIT